MEDREIKQYEENGEPKTGGNFSPEFWLVVAVLSVIIVILQQCGLL